MKISSQILIGYALVLFLFGIVTYVNRSLSERVNENTEWLSHSENVIRMSAQVHRGIIDMENALRGYLLTGKESFLQPYYAGEQDVPKLLDELKTLVKDDSFQNGKLDTISGFYTQWHDRFTISLIESKQNSLISEDEEKEYRKLLALELKNEVGKNITDAIRAKFKQFNNHEYNLRQQRREILSSSVANTNNFSIILIVVSLLLGISGAYYITNVISNRIKEMVTAAERIAQGYFKVEFKNSRTDELTSLSQSLSKMAATLDDTFTDLERKNADLNQFAYVVSHDLKAPLRGIENVMSWIYEDVGDKLDPQVKQYLEMISGRTKRMENLINGILDFSRVGRNKKPVESVNVHNMLEEIIETMAPPKEFTIEIKPNMPVLITERMYLEQVFTNLISNAIKYHDRPDGHIEIGVSSDNKFYTFYVKDDGPGIESEYHERIFVIFQTLKERDAFESTGVGLAIVKKIVEDKGGKIWVESQLDKGSVFYFTWPVFGEQ
ncbi:MAG: sensor histidine kinase [Bacteroidia bacterium]